MAPSKPLPFPDCWASTDDYVENLLNFATTSDLFQILCGGVHILDFFTSDPGLFHTVIPAEWRSYLLHADPMRFLDLLMRDDLDSITTGDAASPSSSSPAGDDEQHPPPPESLVTYIRQIRKFSLARVFDNTAARQGRLPKLTRPVSVGMKPKKVHEVCNFANYVDNLASDIRTDIGGDITHFVDFGSGQNYLGRALASEPYNRQIVAVEGREHNIAGAKELDLFAGVVEKPKVMRNKKLWMQKLDSLVPPEQLNAKAQRRAEKLKDLKISDDFVTDFRPLKEIGASYEPEQGRGHIRYIEGRLESGDLTDVITQLENDDPVETTGSEPGENKNKKRKQLRLMAISIHSCGNLSHHGIRSLIMNPRVEAIAIVGCCYNLVTEKLGPPTYKHPYMRPSLQALNGRVVRESAKKDPQGFPMSQRLCVYKDMGIRLNITARMMACQAPQNWTDAESDSFFTRHFYRAVLQKLFLDKGVIKKVYHKRDDPGSNGDDDGDQPPVAVETETPFNTSTNPVIIGSLRKSCYKSFNAYVRGAVAKLTTNDEYHEYCDVIREKMGDITDEEIARYEADYAPRKRELSAIWSLMAFSAVVVESLIVTDRYLFLKQHSDLVQKCWVEPVFDYQQSPRNLVVVGVKQSGVVS